MQQAPSQPLKIVFLKPALAALQQSLATLNKNRADRRIDGGEIQYRQVRA